MNATGKLSAKPKKGPAKNSAGPSHTVLKLSPLSLNLIS